LTVSASMSSTEDDTVVKLILIHSFILVYMNASTRMNTSE